MASKANKNLSRTKPAVAPPHSADAVNPQRPTIQHIESIEASLFSGPLPDPNTLKAYDLALAGLAERIVTRWEAQTEHRMHLEKTEIEGDNRRAFLGLICATLISLTVVGVSAILAMNGHEGVAAILAGLDIATLAGVFVYGTNARKRERTEKSKIMTGQMSRDGN